MKRQALNIAYLHSKTWFTSTRSVLIVLPFILGLCVLVMFPNTGLAVALSSLSSNSARSLNVNL